MIVVGDLCSTHSYRGDDDDGVVMTMMDAAASRLLSFRDSRLCRLKSTNTE